MCFSARSSVRLISSSNQSELREKKRVRQAEKRAENGRGPFEKLPEL